MNSDLTVCKLEAIAQPETEYLSDTKVILHPENINRNHVINSWSFTSFFLCNCEVLYVELATLLHQ